MQMKEILALLPGLTMVVFAIWYALQILKGKIIPALSTWIIMALGVILSITTYLISSHFNYLGAALNFGDVLTNIIIISTIVFTRKISLKFRPFEKWYLLVSGLIAIFWLLSHNAFVSNLLVQVILVVSYIPTIHKLVSEKKNTESITAWKICLFASLFALYSSFASSSILSVIYVFRSILMIGIVLGLAIYFNYFHKRISFSKSN
jgi:hypothetical protein